MLATDLGFLAYWILSALGVVTLGHSALLNDWNWSFFGLDLAAIATGLVSLILVRRQAARSNPLMLISLTLTGAAGLLALNFWTLRGEFDLAWWAPNLWLLIFPIVALVILTRETRPVSPT
jgi:hypothetical protein